MAAAAHELAEDHAEVPKEWGKNLVACLTCKLVKTQEQVSSHKPFWKGHHVLDI